MKGTFKEVSDRGVFHGYAEQVCCHSELSVQ